MTSVSLTAESALSGRPEHWHQIDWKHVNQTVRGIQIRIAKATKEENWRKVKALQRFLTRSFCGRALAVRRVTENQGRRTPGVDRVLWSTPEAKWAAIGQLKRRGYQALPLRRVRIPKANGKERLLGIPTMKDRAMQALYLFALQPVSETRADRDSYGFRPDRSTADAIMQCYMLLRKQGSPQWVLEADIKGCFDHIDHQWLIDNVPMDKMMLRKWLKAGVVDMGRVWKTEEGTPQGGIISPTLANMALDGIEALLAQHFGAKGSKKLRQYKVGLVRYADDFIITGSSKELLEKEVKPLIEEFLAIRGLSLSVEKTQVTHIDHGFDFLGWTVRKYTGKLLIKPSRKNTKAFLTKCRDVINANKSARQVNLIRMLNPIIRGWVNYHKHQVASDAFARVDAQLWRALWRWAWRRHSKKGKRWIASRYWQHIDNRLWTFADTEVDEWGVEKTVKLVYATDTKIRRHTKVKSEANPFDPEWELYFEELRDRRMQDSLQYRRRVSTLYVQQFGKCALCKQAITHETGWHEHHLIQRVNGGDDSLANLVLLHPACHVQVHHQHISVTKPTLSGVS
ncbi:MAG: group II intron reverse transcriptase/maturase [Bacterioplanes sp.]|nr:group II intron reverse transcriptase/maturase [Bacterioplanes sp.]